MINENFILLDLILTMENIQSSGKAGKAEKINKLTDKELGELEKWIDECPDTRRFEGNVYISLSAFKFMLRWTNKDLMSDVFLDVLSAVKQKRGINPIQQFLVKDMDPETIAILKKYGVKI